MKGGGKGGRGVKLLSQVITTLKKPSHIKIKDVKLKIKHTSR